MLFWLLSFGIARNPQIVEVSLGAYGSETISLESDDAFFISSLETDVEFTQVPAATHVIEFVAGAGYAFRGTPLIVRSRSAESAWDFSSEKVGSTIPFRNGCLADRNNCTTKANGWTELGDCYINDSGGRRT
jgi:hypothetical protein